MDTTTLGEMVAERPSRSRVFEQFGLDYCCGGGRPLAEACAQRGVELAAVQAALAAAETEAAPDDRDWRTATLTELTEHIVVTHHAYLKRELPRLDGLVAKVASVHGERHDYLGAVLQTYRALAAELSQHMPKEEQILFPYMAALDGPQAPFAPFGTVRNPIGMMEHEHENAGAALAELRLLTSGYQPPVDACNTFRAMLDGLAELEADTHVHIHKENNILHPRALAREAELRG